jgi:hypothetical protein
MRFSRLLSVVCCFVVIGCASLFAQQKDIVEVDRVNIDFVRGGGDWLVVNVKVRCNGGTAGARGPRTFANKVRVVLTMAYQGATEREFQFYTSESTAIALIGGQTYDFAYYLPFDLLNKRDNIRKEPFGYLVELFVEDQPIPLNRNSVGKQPTPETLQSFLCIFHHSGLRQ